ncbi:VCBS domain-containing protein [Paludibacterium purpuratum]|uniref:VCBS repeat-containing protein n=1 Tax=Paludibacterium purpuratum TaxID=1144873 RepID=A0A4R7B9C0_9NEIS|nr:VCBS domain-containing protein [Paludibacterium purpuratum]TDR81408.1 VCBS repeat-containing protein [Paludibacterium purpuratum]
MSNSNVNSMTSQANTAGNTGSGNHPARFRFSSDVMLEWDERGANAVASVDNTNINVEDVDSGENRLQSQDWQEVPLLRLNGFHADQGAGAIRFMIDAEGQPHFDTTKVDELGAGKWAVAKLPVKSFDGSSESHLEFTIMGPRESCACPAVQRDESQDGLMVADNSGYSELARYLDAGSAIVV